MSLALNLFRAALPLAGLQLVLATSTLGADTTSLDEMLAAVRQNPDVSRESLPLEREWVGDIDQGDGSVRHLRLEQGVIREGKIVLLRIYPNGSYVGGDAPDYRESLPGDEQLRKCETRKDLEKLLGEGFPGFSAWGDGRGKMHSSISWTLFSPAGNDRLVYLSVTANTSWSREAETEATVEERVEGIGIGRGEMRPTDPDNAKEKAIYLSGAKIFKAEEAAKATAREKYPQPLRDLVEIDEHPSDSDLKLLSAAVQAIRDDPDPLLFRQIAREMHEGTLKISSLLTHILLNEYHSLDLEPWKPGNEAIAVAAVIDALPLVKQGSRDDLVEIVLGVCGGGKIEIEGPHGGRRIEVELTQDGRTLTLGSASQPLSLADAQSELRRLFDESRSAAADTQGTASDPVKK